MNEEYIMTVNDYKGKKIELDIGGFTPLKLEVNFIKTKKYNLKGDDGDIHFDTELISEDESSWYQFIEKDVKVDFDFDLAVNYAIDYGEGIVDLDYPDQL